MQCTPVILKLALVFISDVVRDSNTSSKKVLRFHLCYISHSTAVWRENCSRVRPTWQNKVKVQRCKWHKGTYWNSVRQQRVLLLENIFSGSWYTLRSSTDVSLTVVYSLVTKLSWLNLVNFIFLEVAVIFHSSVLPITKVSVELKICDALIFDAFQWNQEKSTIFPILLMGNRDKRHLRLYLGSHENWQSEEKSSSLPNFNLPCETSLHKKLFLYFFSLIYYANLQSVSNSW